MTTRTLKAFWWPITR